MKIPYDAINRARFDYGTPIRKHGMELITTDNRKIIQSEQEFLIKDGESIFSQKNPTLPVLSEIFDNPETLTFEQREFAIALDRWNVPHKSIRARIRCGQGTGIYGKPNGHRKGCKYDKHIEFTRNCFQSGCLSCNPIRRKRIIRRFLAYMKSLPVNRKNRIWTFLTLNIPNTDTYTESYDIFRKYFPKVMRHPYFKQRIKGTLQTIEGKVGDKYRITHDMKDGKWNVHLHIIVYGGYLDNKVRGKCLDCKQNQMKKDARGYYCVSCKSRNVELKNKGNSTIKTICEKYFPGPVHVDIRSKKSPEHNLNYMLKYVSKGKGDFDGEDPIDMEAEYVASTRNKRLINATGIFFNFKFRKGLDICEECGGEITGWEIVLNPAEFFDDSQDIDLGEALVVTEESVRDY